MNALTVTAVTVSDVSVDLIDACMVYLGTYKSKRMANF